MLSSGFSPIADANARVLILGTLPGQMSLQLGQYYAQPRNVFWKIMGVLVGAGPELAYEERVERLKRRGIALWDVCAEAHRPGSLDTSIAGASVVSNDIGGFLRTHPEVRLLCFNGAKAEALYRRLVLPALPGDLNVRYLGLPSTSPAHAAMRLSEKRDRWAAIESFLV
ncbi:MAG: DNA-deoxyinosine glycosylase [Ramlibacter sp.]|nr:DNA-deoxyinosine glycosylase [Ramlibacter sp.]